MSYFNEFMQKMYGKVYNLLIPAKTGNGFTDISKLNSNFDLNLIWSWVELSINFNPPTTHPHLPTRKSRDNN